MDISDVLNTLESSLAKLTLLLQKSTSGDAPIVHDLSSQKALGQYPAFLERLKILDDIRLDLSIASQSIHHEMARMKQALSPINLLPVEIIQRIFTTGYWATSQMRKRPEFTVRVSSVSQRWRDVATTHGILWTTFRLDFPPDFVSLCLQRVGPHRPIYMTNSWSQAISQVHPPDWIRTGLCPFERWNSLHMISCPHDSHLWRLMRQLFPRLQALNSILLDMPVPRYKPYILADDHVFRNVRSLHIVNIPLGVLPFILTQGLRDIRIDRELPDAEVRNLLVRCTSLERLHLDSVARPQCMATRPGFIKQEALDALETFDPDGERWEGIVIKAPDTLKVLHLGENVHPLYLVHLANCLSAPYIEELCLYVSMPPKTNEIDDDDWLCNWVRLFLFISNSNQ